MIFSKKTTLKQIEFSDAKSLQECLIDANLSISAASKIAALGRHSLTFSKAAKPAAPGTGATKIGGVPDLPTGIDWPIRPPYPNADISLNWFDRLRAMFPESKQDLKAREYRQTPQPLNFIAQVNCSDLSKHFTGDMHLPEQGILYFFYDDLTQGWGFDPRDAIGVKVIYVEGPEDLKATKSPSSVDEVPVYNELFFDAEVRFEPHADIGIRFDALHLGEEDSEAYAGFIENLIEWQSAKGTDLGWPERSAHKLSGWPDTVQGPMEEECALVSQGIYCGGAEGYNSDVSKEILRKPNNWELLLQIDSDDDAKMMWGDAGMLYFWIKRSDLEKRDFGNVWLILQCT